MPGLMPKPRHPKTAASAKNPHPSLAVGSTWQCRSQSPAAAKALGGGLLVDFFRGSAG